MAKKILVIDDEELVSESLKKLLKREGYEASVARSGVEALAKIKDAEFDLIVSDIRMPDMNGIDIVKKIRVHLKESGKRPVPEILITGFASEDNLEEAKKLNVADYIYKPFNIKEFLDIVRRNLTS